jgi:transglutaminase-like putative cysteine protease
MMFRPRDSYDQKLLDATMLIEPRPANLRWLHDVFGNCVAVASFEGAARELYFESNITLDHSPSNDVDTQIEDAARHYPFSYDPAEMPDLVPLIARQYPADEAVTQWVRQFLHAGRPTATGALLMTITRAISESFVYRRRLEKGTQTPAETLYWRQGTCRDFALLMIEAVRSLGFAARFVSGYIYVPGRDEPVRRGGGSTHAWCQVYLPGSGWVEFDPTNGIVGSRDLIRVAVAREPGQAVPLSGTYTGAREDCTGMDVEVQVRRLDPPAPLKRAS